MLIRICGLVVLWCCLLPPASQAAQFDVRPSASGSWVFVRGAFLADDGARFQRLLAATPDAAVVALESDGGRLVAGLDIGNAIRARELATVVLDGTQCASACAVAWLGGAKRFMGASARIGFHAAYRMDAQRNTRESGAGNAVLGAYLNRLGLSDRAIIYITRAAPNQTTWLTLRDAEALGIDAFPFTTAAANPLTPSPAMQAAGVAAQGLSRLDQAAQAFVLAHYAQAGQVGVGAQDYFQSAYAEGVTINGVLVPRETLLATRKRMGTHWPEQAYTIRPDTLRARCVAATRHCDVTGVMDWEWSSWGRGARSTGSANFAFQLSFEGEAGVIRTESEIVFAHEGSGPQ